MSKYSIDSIGTVFQFLPDDSSQNILTSHDSLPNIYLKFNDFKFLSKNASKKLSIPLFNEKHFNILKTNNNINPNNRFLIHVSMDDVNFVKDIKNTNKISRKCIYTKFVFDLNN